MLIDQNYGPMLFVDAQPDERLTSEREFEHLVFVGCSVGAAAGDAFLGIDQFKDVATKDKAAVAGKLAASLRSDQVQLAGTGIIFNRAQLLMLGLDVCGRMLENNLVRLNERPNDWARSQFIVSTSIGDQNVNAQYAVAFATYAIALCYMTPSFLRRSPNEHESATIVLDNLPSNPRAGLAFIEAARNVSPLVEMIESDKARAGAEIRLALCEDLSEEHKTLGKTHPQFIAPDWFGHVGLNLVERQRWTTERPEDFIAAIDDLELAVQETEFRWIPIGVEVDFDSEPFLWLGDAARNGAIRLEPGAGAGALPADLRRALAAELGLFPDQ